MLNILNIRQFLSKNGIQVIYLLIYTHSTTSTCLSASLCGPSPLIDVYTAVGYFYIF